MKSKRSIIAGAVFTIVLQGCAVKNDRTELGFIGLSYHADIKEVADGLYRAEVEASPGRGRIRGAKAAAYEDAVKYCEAQSKAARVVKERTDSHVLINGVARLDFSCA
ncbi:MULTISPECIES: hypothetical protein [Pseudomonas aeruginosa group]|nr:MULTISPECIES: hypothetical protein [Pseudomonas aeruginosa group]AVR66478.1 hypothetical protein B7D75_05675 [Pseudomonas paraeruginosa]KAB0749340.1 hypothetical protein F7O94_07930 [Pseudomonas aeruginosa]KPD30766.1 hypothetical protein AN920_04665 [Pseudomonas paraeruginosa]KQB30790.1 hypothetical protein AOA77_19030 [Pseudomonas paraeruginosa]KSD70155.1 hypothetical protein AO903_17160 [Pseudomonas aeruginosa]